MKKTLSFIAVFMLFVPMSSYTLANNSVLAGETCFSIARNWVIQTEGEINLDNVGFVLELTEYLSTTGACS